VFNAALSLCVNDERRWSPSTTGGYHTINLCQNPELADEDAVLEYQVDGMLFALYLIHVGVGPDPISPFVLLAASTDDMRSMELSHDYILGMIPDALTAEGARQIIQFGPDDTFGLNELHMNKLAVLATVHMDIEVTVCSDNAHGMPALMLRRQRVL
jgi:hypothetical protein